MRLRRRRRLFQRRFKRGAKKLRVRNVTFVLVEVEMTSTSHALLRVGEAVGVALMRQKRVVVVEDGRTRLALERLHAASPRERRRRRRLGRRKATSAATATRTPLSTTLVPRHV